MNNTKGCVICQHPLQGWNRQFYCCDRNQRYCIVCRPKNCIRCRQPITKQLQPPRCRQCRAISSQDGTDMVYQPNCDQYYCAKCVVTRIMRKDRPGMVCSLPCGHGMMHDKLTEFIKGKYCFICGKAAQPAYDYDLINGNIACDACFRFQLSRIGQFVLRCINCDEIMKKIADVGSFNQGFLVCKKCKVYSEIQENALNKQNEQKKVEQQKLQQAMKNMKLNQPSKIQPQPTIKIQPPKQNQPLRQEPPLDYEVKVIQPRYQGPQQNNDVNPPPFQKQSNSQMRQVKSPPKSPTNENQQKIFNSFSQNSPNNQSQSGQSYIQVGKLQNQQRSPSKQIKVPSNPIKVTSNTVEKKISTSSKNSVQSMKKTILQHFPSQKQQPSNAPKTRMKKHLSMQTFVQKMKIKIQKQNCKLIICNECEYQLPQSQCFTIENAQHQLKNYCRLCYTFLTNTQLLSFNVNQLNPILDQSRNKRGISSQKYRMPTNSVQLSPQQQYLAPGGASGIQHMKMSANNFDIPQNPNNHFNHHKVSATVRVSDGKSIYRKQCAQCKIVGRTLISTSNRGEICTVCYARKV